MAQQRNTSENAENPSARADLRRGRGGGPAAATLVGTLLLLTNTAIAHAADAPESAPGSAVSRPVVGGFDVSERSIPVERIVSGGPGRDGIPSIDRPRFIAAGQATFLQDDDLVVGLLYAGQPRAYPLRILNWHEVVNDEIDDRPVLVSFCPLTGSSVVFDRRIDYAIAEFGVSGRLYEGNVLMYDRATQSLWSQLGGRAVTGPMNGTPLRELPSVRTTWRAWRASHPDTLVLTTETGAARDYQRDPYATYKRSANLMFAPSRYDPRIPAKELVLGVVLDGKTKAYPFSELEVAGQEHLIDRIDGTDITIRFDQTSAWAERDGRTLAATVAYWFAWSAFHPDTDVWTTARPTAAGQEQDASAARAIITRTDSYWTSLAGGFTIETGTENHSNTGLFVVTGKLQNVSQEPIRRVWLRFDLLDAHGEPVYSEQGVNGLAEDTLTQADAEWEATVREEAKTIAPGAGDDYRMIFIGSEIPRFRRVGVEVLSVQ